MHSIQFAEYNLNLQTILKIFCTQHELSNAHIAYTVYFKIKYLMIKKALRFGGQK